MQKTSAQIREAFKNYLADFFRHPPLSFFGHNDFPLKEEGGTPPFREGKNPLKKKAIFGQKMLILALCDPFFSKISGDFPLRGEGGGTPHFPISVKGFLAK